MKILQLLAATHCHTFDELRTWADALANILAWLDEHRLTFLEQGQQDYFNYLQAEYRAQQALCNTYLTFYFYDAA